MSYASWHKATNAQLQYIYADTYLVIEEEVSKLLGEEGVLKLKKHLAFPISFITSREGNQQEEQLAEENVEGGELPQETTYKTSLEEINSRLMRIETILGNIAKNSCNEPWF